MQKKCVLKNNEQSKQTASFLQKFGKRIASNPPGVCPIATCAAFLHSARSQSCGKCIPCSKGLEQLENMMQDIIDGNGDMDTYVDMIWLAQTIRDTADCAIGYDAAYEVLRNIKLYRDEYMSHIEQHKCSADVEAKIPCMYNCPANVNIPGYIALIGNERYADAVALIRQDNPFPTSCAFVCERPCELQCRRGLIDAEVNVRGLKKYAVDKVHSDKVPVPEANVFTGKRITIIGGGPSGLTAAYYLSLMGHKVVIFEAKENLGGMLRYGIPNYRLPKDRLDEDINAILSTGNIEVHTNSPIGGKITLENLLEEYDAVYMSIGAQKGKIIPLEGHDSPDVLSAVEMLDRIGHGDIPDLTGKRVCIIGGGNVAMDCARSAIRCGASSVTAVVKEHQFDMTALPSEIQGAIEEGMELMTMYAPVKIKTDENGHVISLVTQPQITGVYGENGLPVVRDAEAEPYEIECDIIYMAIGQVTVSEPFKDYGVNERGIFKTEETTKVKGAEKLFAGGDCVTGPATAIKAIGAGKIAAINIDEFLGYHHKYKTNIDIPDPTDNFRHHYGRVNLTERSARERKTNFDPVENGMSHEEAMQECKKCLRCDHYGCGSLVGGDI
ncbi:MAG: FAD-dependent oxidoreductase [Firmicutes bacterium]|nr:FAD-dependent oxidoreductase [Bacillota bacterium]